jgi:hypothetical protein
VKVLLAYVVAVMPNAYFDLWPGAINCFDGEGWPRLSHLRLVLIRSW